MTDDFFTKTKCDRCRGDATVSTMSWFTEQKICMPCSDKERDIRSKLPEMGRRHEGCGYIPEVRA